MLIEGDGVILIVGDLVGVILIVGVGVRDGEIDGNVTGAFWHKFEEESQGPVQSHIGQVTVQLPSVASNVHAPGYTPGTPGAFWPALC